MLSYEILVHCICGEVKKYKLNALRSQIVILGRQQENLKFPCISLCGDDNSILSRTELYFAFDVNDRDWVVGNGFPDEKYWKYDNDIKELGPIITKQKKVFYEKSYIIENNRFHSKLADAINDKIEDKNNMSNDFYEGAFSLLENNKPIRFEKISGIGIVPFSEKNKIKYQNQVHTGIKHLILPEILFHWYIEIKNNRKDTIAVKSYIEKTNFISKE